MTISDWQLVNKKIEFRTYAKLVRISLLIRQRAHQDELDVLDKAKKQSITEGQ